MIPTQQFVDVGGRRLWSQAAGDALPGVLLIAGGGMPGLFLQPLQQQIAPFARTWLYDRAGLGQSDRASSALSFGGHAQDLHKLIGAVAERQPVILVGESYGGLVARTFAATYPELVAGVVLVDSAEEGHVFANLTVLERAGRQQLRIARRLAAMRLMQPLVQLGLPRIFRGPVRAALAESLARPSHWDAAANEMAAYHLTPTTARRTGGFGELGATPLTVIAHERPFRGPLAPLERDWRAAQMRLAELSSDSRLVVAVGCGHAIAQTAPELVAAEVQSLLRRQPRCSRNRQAVLRP